MAVDRRTPARSRFRTAVRRKSWGMRFERPAARQAVSQARRKDFNCRACNDKRRLWWHRI